MTKTTNTMPYKRPRILMVAEVNQHMAEKLTAKDKEVCQALCDHFGIELHEMFLIQRTRAVTTSRHLFCLWQRKKTLRPLREIGEMARILPIDHTTVLHSASTAGDLIATDDMVRAAWEKIKDICPCQKESESLPPDPAWIKTKVDNRHLIAKCV